MPTRPVAPLSALLALILLALASLAPIGRIPAEPAQFAENFGRCDIAFPRDFAAGPGQNSPDSVKNPLKSLGIWQGAGNEDERPRSNGPAGDASVILGAPSDPASGGVSAMVSDALPDVSGTAIYLRPGDDIQSIVDASAAGQVFVLTAGLYHNLTIAPKDNQTFIGEDGAVLSGAVGITGWSESDGVWSASGFPDPGWSHGEGRDGLAALTEDLFFDGVPLTRVGSLAEITEGTFYYENGTVYTRADPTGRTTFASATQTAFAGGSTTGVTIANLTVEYYASPAQHGAIEAHSTTGWTLIDVTATGNHGAGVSAGDGTRILGGVYSGNGQVGIHAYDTTGLLIDGVTVENNNYAGFSDTWDAGGIKILTSDSVTVRNSEIAGNAGMGLWLDWDNFDVTIENNYVHDNAYVGIFYEASYDAVIRGNTVADNNQNGYVTGYWGAEILVTSSAGIEITDNLVISSVGQGIGLEQSTRENGAYGAHALTDAVVSGNTIVMTEAGLNGVSGPVRNVTWDGNTYVASALTDLRYTWEDRYLIGSDQSGSGMDTGSTVIVTDQPAPDETGAAPAETPRYEITSGETLAFATGSGQALTGSLGVEALLLGGAGHGTVMLDGNGGFTYQPEPGYAGADQFRYFALDAAGRGHIGVAEITVAASATATPDTLVLRVSGDSWNGDPTFDVTVDGQVFEGLSTSAAHSRGEWQEITLTGDFGGRPDSVAVSFTNDAWAGAGQDRNLYVRDLTLNGETYDAGTARSTAGYTYANVAPLATNGTVAFDTDAEADVLILKVSGDSWDGDPEFQISVNGKLAQGFTVSADHGAGEWQEITLRGALGQDDAAEVRVDFVNDIWLGPGQDRNLYIAAVTYNGHALVATLDGSAEWFEDTALLSRNDGLTFDL